MLKIVYLLMRWLFGLTVLVFRGDKANDAELLVLRHENAALRRHAGRVRYEPADRAWFAALAHVIPRTRWAGLFPVTPATLLARHRRLTARRYDTSKRCKPGRPPTIAAVPATATSSNTKRTGYRPAIYDEALNNQLCAYHTQPASHSTARISAGQPARRKSRANHPP